MLALNFTIRSNPPVKFIILRGKPFIFQFLKPSEGDCWQSLKQEIFIRRKISETDRRTKERTDRYSGIFRLLAIFYKTE